MEKYVNLLKKQNTTNTMVFLLLALPMGIIYFTLTVVGFSLGVGTLVIWIGLPVLFATLFMVQALATVERTMVRSLLQMPHPDQPYGRPEARGFLRRFGNLLRDPYTWTGMIYMLFLKLPLGILSFTLTVVFVTLSAALTCLPLVYLLNLFINSILLKSGVPSPHSILIPYFVEIHGLFDPLAFVRSFAGIPLGLVLWFMTGSLLRGLAVFSGSLANAMLGPGVTPYQVLPHTPSYAAPVRPLEQLVYND